MDASTMLAGWSPLPLHFGAVHAYESMIALVLAGAPFLVLLLVIVVRRRHDLADEAQGADDPLD